MHAAVEVLALRCINREDQYPESKWVITVYLHARFISYLITNHWPPGDSEESNGAHPSIYASCVRL